MKCESRCRTLNNISCAVWQTPEYVTNLWQQQQQEAGSEVERDEAKFFSKEQELMHVLVGEYENSVRPVFNASSAVDVMLGLTLTQILDLVSDVTGGSWTLTAVINHFSEYTSKNVC